MGSIIYVSGRQLGKTEQIIRWWLADPERRVIITSSVATAQITRNRIKQLVTGKWPRDHWKLIEQSVVTWSDAMTNKYMNSNREIGIDDLENTLGHLFGRDPSFITLTGQIFGEQDNDG